MRTCKTIHKDQHMLATTIRNVHLIHTPFGTTGFEPAVAGSEAKARWWLTGLIDGPVKKAMVKTPARQSAMPVTLAMPEELLSFTSSILVSKHFIPGIYTWLVTAEYIVRVPYIIYRHWSLDSCLSILLLLIIRGYDGVSMLTLTRCIRKKDNKSYRFSQSS